MSLYMCQMEGEAAVAGMTYLFFRLVLVSVRLFLTPILNQDVGCIQLEIEVFSQPRDTMSTEGSTKRFLVRRG